MGGTHSTVGQVAGEIGKTMVTATTILGKIAVGVAVGPALLGGALVEGLVAASRFPAGIPLRMICNHCGTTDSYRWYNRGLHQIEFYVARRDWEVVADGGGKWICKSCPIPHEWKDCYFLCDRCMRPC